VKYEYVLTKRGYNALIAKGYKNILVCAICGKPLKPGDKVRKQTKKGHLLRYVHVECFESLFVVPAQPLSIREREQTEG